MAPESEEQVARARALAQHHRRIAAALRYVLERNKDPEELAPFITGAAASLIEVLQSEDRYTRTLIESALALAEADAAQLAASSVELNGKAPLQSIQRVAEEAVKEVAAAGKSKDKKDPIGSLDADGRAYVLALARLAEIAGREPYVR